ncbi:MAG: penicillin acylase family protein, partial [bacterium]
TVVFLSYRLLHKSLPETSGSLNLSILSEPVEVYRDEYGVPHIFADNEKDLFKVAGFVSAQDRLWQMDFNRRTANGELSEVIGSAALDFDKHVRLWGFARTAAKIADTLSQQSRTALEAYTAGVNAFIDSHTDRLPIEFLLLDYKPRHWKIEDSIAFIRLMGWKLSFSWYTDLVLQELTNRLGEKKAREVFPDFPRQGPLIVPSTSAPFWTSAQKFINDGLAVQAFLGIQGGRLGSNSWVVSGQKTISGKPLLANDPHLTLTAPSVWYEMHLSAGDLNVAGVSFPGVPGIVIGHNDRIAWGLTNGMIDDVDFYFETINPQNAEQYWDGSKWADFERLTEEIKVKEAPPETLQIKISRNGPVISQFHPVLQGSDNVVSMRWVGHETSDELLAYLKLQKARTWDEFAEALATYKVPAQNFIFASSDGDIGYYLAGAVPIRFHTNGVLPHDGRRKTGQWIGQIPFDKLPHILNPPEGYIATANNKIVDDRYPYYLTNLWEPPSRAARIHRRLSDKELFSLDDFKDMQADDVSEYARDILPAVLSTLAVALDSTASEDVLSLYRLLNGWDGKESPGSIAASIFNAFVLKLTENTLKDEMGESLYGSYIRL